MTNAPSNAPPNTNTATGQSPSAAETKQIVLTQCSIFDFSVEAELFPARSRKHGRSALGYRRFAHAADAIRFAIEELPPEVLLGAFLEVDGERYDGKEVRRLYDSADFPQPRRAPVELQ